MKQDKGMLGYGKKEIKPLTDAEISIIVARLQGAILMKDMDKIDEILGEVRKRYDDLKKNGMWRE